MSRPRLFLVLAAWGLLLPSARAQDDGFRTGTHVLRRLLHQRKFTALDSWQSAMEQPERTVLLLIGNPKNRAGQYAWQIPRGLEQFVRRGGAVLMATDHPLSVPDVSRFCGYRVAGNRVHAWLPDGFQPPANEGKVDPKYLYRGREAGLRECIILDPVADADPPLFWEIKGEKKTEPIRVVTNRSASLTRADGVAVQPTVRVLARFPDNCWYQVPEGMAQPQLRDAFAVSREVNGGRFLLMSDHSVLINEMLLQEDNGNLDFTYKAIEWLQDPKDRRRTRVLIVEDGEIQSHLDIPLTPIENPLQRLQPVFTDEVNKKIGELQANHRQTGHFDNLVVEGVSHIPGQWLAGRFSLENFYLVLAVVAGVGLALFGFARLVRGSHGIELAPVFASFAVRHRPEASTLALRQRSALSGNDLREFARQAAREWFAALPGYPPEGEEARRPRIEAKGGWWRRRKMRREVLELWDLASGAAVSRLSRGDFRALLERFAWLRESLDAGELRITWE